MSSRSTARTGGSAPPQTLADSAVFFAAVESFVRAHANIDASHPINTALAALGACNSLQTMFVVPLKERIFNLESVLQWALFLMVASSQESSPFPPKSFSVQAAMEITAQLYDLGIDEMVWTHFEAPDDEDEDDGEEDEVDEAG